MADAPRISSPYGARTIGGRREHHTGEDYAAACGTPIAAAIDGRARVVRLRDSYGWHVWIDGADGLSCLVAHLSAIHVEDGARVRRGELIAESGGAAGVPGSGRSTGCHTHYEERVGGRDRRPRFGARIWEVRSVLTKDDKDWIERVVQQATNANVLQILRALSTGEPPGEFNKATQRKWAAYLKRLPWVK